MPQNINLKADVTSVLNTGGKTSSAKNSNDQSSFSSTLNSHIAADKAKARHTSNNTLEKKVKEPAKKADKEPATKTDKKTATKSDKKEDIAAKSKDTSVKHKDVEKSDTKTKAKDSAEGKGSIDKTDSTQNDKDTAQVKTTVDNTNTDATPLNINTQHLADTSKPTSVDRRVVDKSSPVTKQVESAVKTNQVSDSKIITSQASTKTQSHTLKPDSVSKLVSERPVQLAETLKNKNIKDHKSNLRADIVAALQRRQAASDSTTVQTKTQTAIDVKASSVDALTATTVSDTKATTGGISFTHLSPISNPAQQVGQGSLASTTTPASATTTNLPVQPQLQNPAWGNVMSGRVVWMAKEGLQNAQLTLNPADLGPIQVQLQMKNDQASVIFHAHHPMTREALEQALPKLRDSFSNAGMQLNDAQVGGQAFSDSQQSQQNSQADGKDVLVGFVDQPQDSEDEVTQSSDHIANVKTSTESGVSLYA